MKNPVSIMAATPEYGIGVTKNRFALVDLEEEVDPLELLERKEKEKEEKKKAKLIEKETKAKQPVVAAKPKPPKILKETQKKAVNDVPKVKEEKEKRFPKKEVNFAESRTGNNREQGKENWFEEDSGMRDSGDGERKSFRGNDFGGENRGMRGGRARGTGGQRGTFVRGGERGRGRGGFQRFDTRGKREYDRQSGSDKTGVKPVDKRDGFGAHNWGNAQDDWERTPQEDDWAKAAPPEDDWNTPQEDAGWEAPAVAPDSGVQEGGAEDAEAPPAGEEAPKVEAPPELVEEPEKQEMTLDEWKAMKKQREQPKYNVRKPGEGEDLTQWKKMFVLEKKKEGVEEDEDDEEYEIGLYPQRVGRQKRIFDINIKFKDTRGNTEMRGRGRGGRGRGGPRARSPPPIHHFHSTSSSSKDHSAQVPKVDDEKAFPSLV